MIKPAKFALCSALALVLSACGNEGSEDLAKDGAPVAAPAATAPAAVAPLPPAVPQKQLPTQVAADAVTVGNSLAADRVVKAARAQFSSADTVYASASVRGKPAGATVSVYWTYQDGTTHKEETKNLASGDQQAIWFSFAQADGMRPGKYNVEIDVNMTPVGIADFQIQ